MLPLYVAFINLLPSSTVLIDLGVVLSVLLSQSVSVWVSGSFLRTLPPPPSPLLAPRPHVVFPSASVALILSRSVSRACSLPALSSLTWSLALSVTLSILYLSCRFSLAHSFLKGRWKI